MHHVAKLKVRGKEIYCTFTVDVIEKSPEGDHGCRDGEELETLMQPTRNINMFSMTWLNYPIFPVMGYKIDAPEDEHIYFINLICSMWLIMILLREVHC